MGSSRPAGTDNSFCTLSKASGLRIEAVPNGGYCLVGGPLGLVTVGEGFWDGEVVAGPVASGCPGSGAGVARADGLAEALESTWMKWMQGTVTSA